MQKHEHTEDVIVHWCDCNKSEESNEHQLIEINRVKLVYCLDLIKPDSFSIINLHYRRNTFTLVNCTQLANLPAMSISFSETWTRTDNKHSLEFISQTVKGLSLSVCLASSRDS